VFDIFTGETCGGGFYSLWVADCAVTRRRRGRPCLKRHFRFREVPNNKMEGKNNLDDLDARLQVLEKRVHGERGGKNNKPVKVIRGGKNNKPVKVIRLRHA